MRKLLYALSAVAILLVTACDSDDDGFYNTKYIQAENLLVIENPSATYSVGDVVTIGAAIDRLIPEPGETELLDVVQTTGADEFQFSYYLEKKNGSGEWEVVDLTNDYIDSGAGHANVGFFVQGFLTYTAIGERYEYQGGVELSSTGQYRLNFSNNTENYNKAFFRSVSPGNNIVLNIFSTSDSLTDVGTFEFTVI